MLKNLEECILQISACEYGNFDSYEWTKKLPLALNFFVRLIINEADVELAANNNTNTVAENSNAIEPKLM